MSEPLAPPGVSGRSAIWWWENSPLWADAEEQRGYLWSSQREPVGAVATRGDMLPSLALGDRVLRVRGNAIVSIAVVTARAQRAMPPRAQGVSPYHWGVWGYRVPVEIAPLNGQIDVRQIPRAWRATLGGPFKSDGGVRTSRLYRLPEPFLSWVLERFANEIPAGVWPAEPLPDTHTATWHELYRRTLAGFFPDLATRRMSQELLSEAIETAHRSAPGSWTTALPDRNLFRMNVARIEVCVLRKGSLYLVLDKDALAPADRDALGETASPVPASGAQYRSAPFAQGFTLPANRVAELLPHARAAHLALVGRPARESGSRTPYASVHQPPFVDYLAAAVGRALPQPDFSLPKAPEPAPQEPEDAWLSGEWRTAWLLSVSPAAGALDDLLAASSVGDGSIWPLSRFWHEMKPGHPVILWQGGADAGIYAVGEVEEAPFEGASGDWDVPIRYLTLLDEPLRVDELGARPVLRELASLPDPGHTVCQVPARLWAALQRALPGSPGGDASLRE